MDDTTRTSPEAWRLQVLKLLKASLSQRQLAEWIDGRERRQERRQGKTTAGKH